jgi:hypothetical protein
MAKKVCSISEIKLCNDCKYLVIHHDKCKFYNRGLNFDVTNLLRAIYPKPEFCNIEIDEKKKESEDSNG